MTAAEGGAAERSAAPFYFTENRLPQTYRREGTMVLFYIGESETQNVWFTNWKTGGRCEKNMRKGTPPLEVPSQ